MVLIVHTALEWKCVTITEIFKVASSCFWIRSEGSPACALFSEGTVSHFTGLLLEISSCYWSGKKKKVKAHHLFIFFLTGLPWEIILKMKWKVEFLFFLIKKKITCVSWKCQMGAPFPLNTWNNRGCSCRLSATFFSWVGPNEPFCWFRLPPRWRPLFHGCFLKPVGNLWLSGVLKAHRFCLNPNVSRGAHGFLDELQMDASWAVRESVWFQRGEHAQQWL